MMYLFLFPTRPFICIESYNLTAILSCKFKSFGNKWREAEVKQFCPRSHGWWVTFASQVLYTSILCSISLCCIFQGHQPRVLHLSFPRGDWYDNDHWWNSDCSEKKWIITHHLILLMTSHDFVVSAYVQICGWTCVLFTLAKPLT